MSSASDQLRSAMERCAADDQDGYRDALMPVFGRWMAHASVEEALANIYGFVRHGQQGDALTALETFHGWYRETMRSGGQITATSLPEALMLRAVLLASERPVPEETASTHQKPTVLN